MVSRMHSEVRRFCQNNRFPTVQGFTPDETMGTANKSKSQKVFGNKFMPLLQVCFGLQLNKYLD